MIRIVGKTENVMAEQVTISFTMSLSEWMSVMDTIPQSGHPHWKIRAGIGKVLGEIQASRIEVINEDEADMRRRDK